MKHAYDSLKNYAPLSTKLALVCFLLLTTAFFPMKIMNYGISNPEAIGAYLNATFPDEAPSSTSSWTAEVAFPNLTFTDPIQMMELPGTNKFIMAGKKGRLWTFDRNFNTSSKTTILNIEAKILTSGDAGLMGIALHPEFGQAGSPNRGYVYIWSRQRGPTNSGNLGYVVLSRYNWPDGANTINANSEFVMIKQYDRHQWHNGGGMFFGLDGFLYISSGDEGGANDQYNTGQKINVGLLAGALRIDVDQDASRSHPIRRQPLNPANPPSGWPNSFSQGYYVPNDNPWVNPSGSVLEEFYSIGFRSPHRMTQDPVTGDIWMGDVGQGSREEVSLVPKGSNLQWPYREGNINGPKSKPSNLIGFDQAPVHAYARNEGTCVIGGFVYRGNKWPSLRGKYIFGDHTTRRVWLLDHNQVSGNTSKSDLVTIPAFGTGSKAGISSFATDSNGEVYILKLFGTNQDGGRIYKLNASNLTPDPPQFLSQTGAFTNLNNLTPADGIIPYKTNAPLWSDGAIKKRWMAVPNNGTYNTAAEDIVWAENNEWQFPEGTVFIKHFEMPLDENDPTQVKRLETRFMVRDKNGGLYGVTYKWNAAGTDAELLPGSDTEPYTLTQSDGSTVNRVWEFPSRSDCMTCHNENSGGVLGVNTHQLNGDFTYPSGTTDNQLRTLNHLGIFNVNLNEANIPNYLAASHISDPTASLQDRVRSYLDANCAHCHQPNGVNATFDAQFTTGIAQQNLINGDLLGSYGVAGAAVVKPGSTSQSILYVRDNSVGTDAMPPLAKSVVDEEYMTVLAAWINNLEGDGCLGQSTTTYLSDLNWVGTPTNGWGPVEKDITNGGTGQGDGGTITINGQTYSKGLGTHANSEIIYNLGGQYTTLLSDIGVDDGTCSAGSVGFEIYLDGNLAYSSPVLTQADPALSINVDVSGVNQLRLVVNDGGSGGNNPIACDHADWADIRLETGCTENQAPIAVFTATPISGNAPLPVAFNATASSDPDNDPITYAWDFGDGSQGSGASPSHTYNTEGTYTAELSVSDNQGNNSINFVEIEVGPVLTQDQTINFPSIADKFNNDPPFNLSATASSGLPVSYQVLSGPASVSGNTVTLSGQSGNVVIRASQAGNGQYNPAPNVDRSFAVVQNPSQGDCYVLSNGQVVIEAENYSAAIPGTGNASGSSWQSYTEGSASSNTALRAEPNTGVWTGLNLNGPRLDYDVNFPNAGTYFVYIRTSAPSGSDDSFHAGLNGNAVTNTSGIGMGVNGAWAWAEDANSGNRVSINVPSSGKHTFNLWMREDGVQVDKIVIKTANTAPSGQGPAESNRGSCGNGGGNQAPVANFSASPTSGTAPLLVNFDASSSTDNEGPIASYAWDFGDGNTATGVGPSHTFTQAGLYTVVLTVTDQGGLTDDFSGNIQVNQDPGNGNACFAEQNGEVVIEAENFSASVAGSGNAAASNWVSYSDGNASNGTALRAEPNTGVWTGLNTNGPRLDYEVSFTNTGIYRVYIRTSSPSGNDDSYHVGLNGNAVTANSGFGMGINGPWAWADAANDDPFVEINVPSVGKHTFNVWMREDGVQIDKIVISKNGGPGGTGPVESGTTPCGGAANQAPTASFTASPSSGFAPLTVNVNASASSDPEGPIANYSWNFGDGNTSSGVSTSHVYTSIGSYTLTLTVTDNEGLSNQSSRIITVSPQGNGPQCFTENGGVVVMEAENYSSVSPGTGNASGSSWTSFTDANASNSEGLRASPNTGVWTGLNTNGPRLDYDISFSTAGTYRIYIRTSGPSSADDSYHVGLNGNSVSSISGYGMGINGPWDWADFANEDNFVEVVVPTTGQHTFNIWMREDGVEIDKIVLKLNPGVPSGQGPTESALANCASQNIQNEGFSVLASAGNANINWGNFFEEFKDNYVLERSLDGFTYETLESDEIIVDRKLNQYSDPNLDQYRADKIFYRLRIKDADGRTRETREGVLTLRTGLALFTFNAYPIPAREKLNIAYENSRGLGLKVNIINSVGQSVYRQEIEAGKSAGSLRLVVEDWAEGVYFIQITDGKEQAVRRILIE